MALEDHGAQAGGHPIRLASLNDGSAARGRWGARRTAANARAAACDPAAIAYIGEFNSGASAISMPITNEAGLLQVSPSNSHTGLTRSLPHVTEPGEPEKYVPLGRRTYGRIAVTDAREADALAEYLVMLGVRRAVLVDDAEIVRQRAGSSAAAAAAGCRGARGQEHPPRRERRAGLRAA